MGSASSRNSVRRIVSLFTIMGLLIPMLTFFPPSNASAATASVVANVHLCPYDLTGLTVYEIAPLCPDQATGLPVTLDNGSGIVLNSTTDGSGLASFTNIDPGISTFYLYPAGVSGYDGRVAGCKEEDGVGNEVSPYTLMPIGGLGDVNFFFHADGNMVYCDFFLYTPGVTPPAPTTYGEVQVNKITCPQGFDGYSADIYGLAAGCQDATQVVTFTLTDSLGASSDATTPGAAVNLATWQNVPSGSLTITEAPLADYGDPRVFCKNIQLAGPEDPETEVGVSNYAITTELKNGYDILYCDWFNISYTEPKVDITINKHLCPDGYGSSDLDELYANCNETYDPVTFKLDGASSGNPGDQTTGDVIPNGVQWTNMDPDTWYILEFLPDGWGEPIVYCTLTEQASGTPGTPALTPVEPRDEGWRITYTVDEGYDLSCDWFNTTGSPYVGISLHKYGCPTTYEQNWTLNDFYQYCNIIVQGAKFTVSGPDSFTDTQTLSGIDLSWDQLAPGDYSVQELQPAVFSGSAVFCTVGDSTGNDGSYEFVDTSSNTLDWSLDVGEYLDCYWYNLPRPVATIDPNAPATLTIVKFTCPEAYDPLATGADPSDDCGDPVDGITFSVIGNNNASLDGETGDDGDGTVTFDDLKAGNYLLQETYPEGVENAFIWSCTSDVRVFNYPFAPFARIDASGTLKFNVVAGETMECDWYNVPTPTDDGVAVAITVLECTNGQVPSSACDPAEEGTGVSLTSVSGDEDPIDIETDADGLAEGNVPADEYEVDADQAICFADSDAITADGTLDVSGPDPVELTVYICS